MVTAQDMAGGPAAAELEAAGFPLVTVARTTGPGHPRGAGVLQLHLACFGCGQAVHCLSPDVRAGGFVTDVATIKAHTVAHLLQCHAGTMS